MGNCFLKFGFAKIKRVTTGDSDIRLKAGAKISKGF